MKSYFRIVTILLLMMHISFGYAEETKKVYSYDWKRHEELIDRQFEEFAQQVLQIERQKVESLLTKDRANKYMEYFEKGMRSEGGLIMMEGEESRWLEIAYYSGYQQKVLFRQGYFAGLVKAAEFSEVFIAQPLQLTIKSDKEVYEVGGEINVRAEIINISDKPVKASDYYKPIDLVVYLNNEYGQKCILNYTDVLRRVMPVEIKPNESINTNGVTFSLPNNVTEHENYKIMGKHSIYMVDGTLTSNTITIEVREKKGQSSKSDKQDKIIQAILKEIIEHYKFLEEKGQGPKEISIAQVDTKKDDIQLYRDSHILKHWTYKDGKLSESKPSVREQIMKENAYWNEPGERFYKIGLITFAIFSDNEGQTVQINESWEGKYGSGVLYRIETTPGGEIKLKQIRLIWES